MARQLDERFGGLEGERHPVSTHYDPTSVTSRSGTLIQIFGIQTAIQVRAHQYLRRAADGELDDLCILQMARIDDGETCAAKKLDLRCMEMRVTGERVGAASMREAKPVIPGRWQGPVLRGKTSDLQPILDFLRHDPERRLPRRWKADNGEQGAHHLRDTDRAVNSQVPSSRIGGRIQSGVNVRYEIGNVIGVEMGQYDVPHIILSQAHFDETPGDSTAEVEDQSGAP